MRVCNNLKQKSNAALLTDAEGYGRVGGQKGQGLQNPTRFRQGRIRIDQDIQQRADA